MNLVLTNHSFDIATGITTAERPILIGESRTTRQHASSSSPLPPFDPLFGNALILSWRNRIDNQQIFHQCHSLKESVGSPGKSVHT